MAAKLTFTGWAGPAKESQQCISSP